MNHVFWAYLDHSLSDMYIGNVLLIYRTKCTISRTKIHAQNKSDKIVFFQTARHTPFGKKTILWPLFFELIWTIISSIYTSEISDLYIGQISDQKTHAKQVILDKFAVWKKTTFANHVFWAYLNHTLSDMYGAPFGKNYTFCEPCFLSLNKLKKHGSQNV